MLPDVKFYYMAPPTKTVLLTDTQLYTLKE